MQTYEGKGDPPAQAVWEGVFVKPNLYDFFEITKHKIKTSIVVDETFSFLVKCLSQIGW
ncbi:hypothetical protein KOR42_38800 [Thalassoglobus neptunius]|uniref:Uncharacterized protein n=1 Tax=Thalassoglobus neptunius TaxID=1938619 RepID=A0A5C5WGA5_9PLAN|nr:hypothetical protein KOR42_38800 [Thalassoglobus neptunius]